MAKYQDWTTPEGLLKIEGWARDGLSMEQIAEKIGIGRSTLHTWAKRHPQIGDSLRRGREVPDRQVENALYKSAVGYRYTEITRVFNSKTGELEGEKTVEREVPPNVPAIKYWLSNRKPQEWGDKSEVDVSLHDDGFLDALRGEAAEVWSKDS